MNRRFLRLILALMLAPPTTALGQGSESVQIASIDAPDTSNSAASGRGTGGAPVAATISTDENGFALVAPDGSFTLRLSGDVMTDGRFMIHEPTSAAANTFYLRRVRTSFEGVMYRAYNFRVQADFGQGKVELQDAYIDAQFSPAVAVQVGRFKEPVGLELLQSPTDASFVEPGFTTGLVPNRDIGMQVHGIVFGKRVQYHVGIFNGVPDGASDDFDSGDSKDLTVRVFTQPFRTAGIKMLAGLNIGIAATYGTEYGSISSASLPTFKSSARATFFKYRSGADAAATAIADGKRTRIVPQAYYSLGPFGILAEYVRNAQTVRLSEASDVLIHRAAQASAQFVLTGEDATYKRLKPKRPFDHRKGYWGAIEVVGRVHTLRLDDQTFPTYADPLRAHRQAFGWGAGLNWHLNSAVRVMVDFERTTFDAAPGGGRPVAENLILSRFQLVF